MAFPLGAHLSQGNQSSGVSTWQAKQEATAQREGMVLIPVQVGAGCLGRETDGPLKLCSSRPPHCKGPAMLGAMSPLHILSEERWGGAQLELGWDLMRPLHISQDKLWEVFSKGFSSSSHGPFLPRGAHTFSKDPGKP